jgi:hypothetical protein
MTMTDTTAPETPDPTILTADELAVLNAARSVCKAYRDRLGATRYALKYEWRPHTDSFDAGKVYAEAEITEQAIFSLVSASHIYLSYDLSHEQLHTPEQWAPTGRTIPGDLRLVPVA